MLAHLLLLFALIGPLQNTDPMRAGWEAIQKGDAEKAAASFRAALAAQPRDAEALAGAGVAAHLLGQDDEAISYLKRALEVRPDYVDAALLLGPIAYSRGDLDLAIDSYQRVVRITPSNLRVAGRLKEWKKEAELHDRFVSRPGSRFNLMFEGPAQQAIADRVSSGLEAAYMRVGAIIRQYPPETITAILYTQQQFRDITKSPPWAVGAYDGQIRIPVLGALNSPGELDRIVTHEYVHALIHATTPLMPRWLNEGLATYLEPGSHAWLTTPLRTVPAFIPLASLDEGFASADGSTAGLAYAESFVATRVLVRRLGPNLPVFLQYVGNGTSLDQALLLFDINPADLERDWEQQMRGR
ncbi:MAG TPA: tetratricopeptide repeat protein [Vicinamibacterales bacterium]|nr:tetratricopeptide repeat protein [Vicinamibacterales bacterium]